MTINKLTTIALAVTLTVSACSMPNFVPAHGQDDEQAAGARLECEMISEGMLPQGGGSFVAASGRPAFVGAAMGGYALGLAIGAAVRQQHKVEHYTDCMIAHGFRQAGR